MINVITDLVKILPEGSGEATKMDKSLSLVRGTLPTPMLMLQLLEPLKYHLRISSNEKSKKRIGILLKTGSHKCSVTAFQVTGGSTSEAP